MGGLIAEYSWGLEGPLLRRPSNVNNTRYYILDGLGHTRLLVDNQGNVTDEYAYDSWGNRIGGLDPTPNPFRWNAAYGYAYIPQTGLYHVGAREYDPRTVRWLQRDPIDAASGDPNLYRYCGNDPVNLVDPDGLKRAGLGPEVPPDLVGRLLNFFGGGSLGFGGGLLYALAYQNNPTRTGHARLGRPNPNARYGWDRSFSIDRDRFNPNPHFNAEFGPLARHNHTDVPEWVYRLGSNRALRNLGRGAVALGVALDALDIATAGPCDRGRAIGGAIGGAVFSGIGTIIGGMLVPGIGAWIGGAVGGFVGSLAGQAIGSLFDPDCDC